MGRSDSGLPLPKLNSADFARDEYSSLRQEMLKRIELQHKILTLTFIAAGTFCQLALSGFSLANAIHAREATQQLMAELQR
jgi:hypothetical protein